MSAYCVFVLHLHSQKQNPSHKRIVRTPQGLFTMHHAAMLAQKRVCCVENVRKVSNLAALCALQARFCAQNLTRG